MTAEKKANEQVRAEAAIQEKYGLRWAVLAAWCDDLEAHGIMIPRELWNSLAEARVTVSAGRDARHDLGRSLGAVEGQLLSLATASGASAATDSVTLWLELLAHAMVVSSSTERLLNIPAVKFRYAECGFGPFGDDS
jgi:hypothetical protein